MAFEQRRVGFQDRPRDEYAGVVHHAVQAAERLGCIDRLGPVGLVGDVMAQIYRGAAEFVCQAPAFRIQHIADHHLGALGDQ